MHGDRLWVADSFRCRRCDGAIQEADLPEDLIVDGETYECVKSFCYLRDTLDGDGGVDLAATARIRIGCRIPVYQLCQKQHDLWK